MKILSTETRQYLVAYRRVILITTIANSVRL